MEVNKIFVCGNSRSGTTLMARSLGLHPNVYKLDELHIYDEIIGGSSFSSSNDIYNELIRRYRLGYFSGGCLNEFLTSEDPVNDFFNQVSLDSGCGFVVEQTPANIRYVDKIRSNLSCVNFVVLVRDPRSVILSQKNKWRRKLNGARKMPLKEVLRVWLNGNSLLQTLVWLKSMRALDKVSDLVCVVHYENFVSLPSKTLKDVCDFLSINFDDAMLNVEVIGSSLSEDKKNVGFDVEKLGSWKDSLSIFDVSICELFCRTYIVRHGYELSASAFVSLIFASLAIPIHVLILSFLSPFILLFNFHRLRDFIGVGK